MTTLETCLVAAGCVLVAGGVVYAIMKKGNRYDGASTAPDLKVVTEYIKKHGNLERQRAEGPVKMTDVVAWFRSLNLDQKKNIPFVMRVADNVPGEVKSSKPILLGVYDKNADEIAKALLIEGDAWDQQLTEVIGNETLVVLS